MSPLKPSLKRQKGEGEGWIAFLSISGFIICHGQQSKEAFPVYRVGAWGVELPPPPGRPQGLPIQETLEDKVTWRQMPPALGLSSRLASTLLPAPCPPESVPNTLGISHSLGL